MPITLVDEVFIVCRHFNDALIVESVWSTRALAESAKHYHAHDSGIQIEEFIIIERKINSFKWRL
jgi:hypothetical protein